MDKQTRRVKLSAQILAGMFRQGNFVHFLVTKGLPPEVEILSMEPDFSSPGSPALIMTVRGYFLEGNDGEIFDIIVNTITDKKVDNPT